MARTDVIRHRLPPDLHLRLPTPPPNTAISFVEDDGGRAAAGFRGQTGDCVTRAIAIATGLPYREVYDSLFKTSGKTPREGVHPIVYKAWLAERGWEWVPTMQIGQGCKVHLRTDELPTGRLIVRLSRHLAAVVDGALHDTHDSSRDGTRCVYGYWKEN